MRIGLGNVLTTEEHLRKGWEIIQETADSFVAVAVRNNAAEPNHTSKRGQSSKRRIACFAVLERAPVLRRFGDLGFGHFSAEFATELRHR